MGKGSRNRTARATRPQVRPAAKATVSVTHEPSIPLPGWPGSHVHTELTGADIDECLAVTIHGIMHYLHADTANELRVSLEKTLTDFGAVIADMGVPWSGDRPLPKPHQ